MLSYSPSGPPKLRYISNGLRSKALELLIWGIQYLHHGLQTLQISNGPPDLRVAADLLQYLQ